MYRYTHWSFIMTNARKSNARANKTNVQSTQQNDERDTTNAVQFPTSDAMNAKPETFFVSLKNVIETHKIKTDPKLIRRVLRKYYTQQTNHQHRDAWMFAQHDVPNVVALIDKHCRANTAAKK
jgi:hypothetical protein